MEEDTGTVDTVKVREARGAVRTSYWNILGQRPRVSLHHLERRLKRLFSRMAELEVAKEEKRLTERAYQKAMHALREKKEKIVRNLERLFNTTQK